VKEDKIVICNISLSWHIYMPKIHHNEFNIITENCKEILGGVTAAGGY
jgi:hypothetical protein